MGTPEILKLLGKETIEGLMFSIADWPLKGQEALVNVWRRESRGSLRIPLCTYGDMWILKEGLELAGKANRKALGEAMHKMETKGGSGQYFPGGGGVMKFDEAGHRLGAEIVIVQWQNGEPFSIYPAASAVKQPIWPK